MTSAGSVKTCGILLIIVAILNFGSTFAVSGVARWGNIPMSIFMLLLGIKAIHAAGTRHYKDANQYFIGICVLAGIQAILLIVQAILFVVEIHAIKDQCQRAALEANNPNAADSCISLVYGIFWGAYAVTVCLTIACCGGFIHVAKKYRHELAHENGGFNNYPVYQQPPGMYA
eukprot:TRINITY_DN198_c0_g1_i1.p2 TRINITY_DN198_c0_g1~~TRINITY_DN198_c0_g1_i1.p2  ORF type:complete len:173 (-),score=39.95 TRINITY_DN198_c0_g1_i1:73-591(-)